MFRRKFWIALILTIPAAIWGEMFAHVWGVAPPAFPGSRFIPLVFGTAVFVYGGWVFLEGAWRELVDRRPGMMTLISLAIVVAFAYSVAVTFGARGASLWWELSSLITIMLLGHWMEMRSISRAQGALTELVKLLPNTATRLTDAGLTEDVPIGALRDGDVVLVRPGAAIPADGTVREGRSFVNESMLTGESKPVAKNPRSSVIAGTVNGDGSLRVDVTRTGDRTALAGIMRLVADAQSSRSRAQVLADRAALWLTIGALASAAITAAAWVAAGAPGSFVVERVVTVLVIACPHALGLAVPLVVALSTTVAARNGLLVRDRRGLEQARLVTTAVFDKTGTLTLGQHRVVGVQTDGLAEDDALRLAAAVEQDSEHPVGRAVLATATDRALALPRAADFRAIPGLGVEATVDGRTVTVGGPNLIRERSLKAAPAMLAFASNAAARGQSVLYLIDSRTVRAAFIVSDAVRPESREAVQLLRDAGIDVAMVTGDSRAAAESVARDLGIDRVFAEVLPAQKVAAIKRLQRDGKRVAMVGDGVNDAAALATADVGIAIGAGTNVAVQAGDIVLVRNDPRDVPRIFALSRATYRKMVQNLWWAAGYNVVAIPLAAGALAWKGIVLSPAAGAVLMSLSTIIVAVNAQLLRRVKL